MRMKLHDERGATIVIVTLALAALMGMTVLVVDVGGLLTLRRRMVLTADAAALAAAQSCGLEEPWDAEPQADSLATANRADATSTKFETEDCGGSSSGRVELGYAAPQTLVFAPILGAPETRPVSAEAEAIWGPAGGAAPMPIELSIDPNGLVDCAYKEVGTECAYWHDNSVSHDLRDSSNWGFMNLSSAGVAPDDACSNSGTNERRAWIDSTMLEHITINEGTTFVCIDSGHSNSSWFAALTAQIGTVRYFPINDPAQMITTAGKEKYAIIGFIPLRVDDVLRGNDPLAVGTPGATGNCRATHTFSPGSRLDLDSLGCYADAEVISNLRIFRRQGGNTTEYREGSDYTFDSTTHVVSWFTGTARDASIWFDWAEAGIAGKCGARRPDPNGVCLVLSWQGVRVAGSLPGAGADFGLRAVRLDG